MDAKCFAMGVSIREDSAFEHLEVEDFGRGEFGRALMIRVA